jgi:hypothetical protein
MFGLALHLKYPHATLTQFSWHHQRSPLLKNKTKLTKKPSLLGAADDKNVQTLFNLLKFILIIGLSYKL